MKKAKTKKLLDKNNPENTIAHVIFRGRFNEEYECAGVLMREEKKHIRVAFNAKNDVVKDYVDIKKSKIISIEVLKHSDIEKL